MTSPAAACACAVLCCAVCVQVFVADSESSTIRELLLSGKGPTRTIVGGSGVNPDNLFAFGDKDGRVRGPAGRPSRHVQVKDWRLLVVL